MVWVTMKYEYDGLIHEMLIILGDPEVTANLYCNFAENNVADLRHFQFGSAIVH